MTVAAAEMGDARPDPGAGSPVEAPVEVIGTADARACQALSDAAGWQHALADWAVRLSAGRGFGIRRGGRLVTVALVLAHPDRAAFLGMLLTDPAHRGQGLGVRLSRWCIDWAHERSLPCCLIAVPKAVPLYRRLGMREVAGEGLVTCRFSNQLAGAEIAVGLRPAEPTDADAITALDALAVGYDRSALLLDLLERGRSFAWVAKGDGGIRGFALGIRRGDTVALGPVIAESHPIGAALLRAQLTTLPANCPVRLDLPFGAAGLEAELGLASASSPTPLLFMTSRPVTALPYARPRMVMAALSAIAG